MNKDATNISSAQLRFDSLVKDFENNGFTNEQATFLINLLSDFVPIP